MKRYIRSDSQQLTETNIEQMIIDELANRNLSNVIKELGVTPRSSVSCEAIAYLSNKYHGKKVRELIKYKNVRTGVDHFVHQIETYVGTGYTMTDEDAYIYMLELYGEPIGYLGKPTGSRMSYWVPVYSDPYDKEVRRMEAKQTPYLPAEYAGLGFCLTSKGRGYQPGKYIINPVGSYDAITNVDNVAINKIKLIDAQKLDPNAGVDIILSIFDEVEDLDDFFAEYDS